MWEKASDFSLDWHLHAFFVMPAKEHGLPSVIANPVVVLTRNKHALSVTIQNTSFKVLKKLSVKIQIKNIH